jgi:phosphoribosylamine-glycine ligase
MTIEGKPAEPAQRAAIHIELADVEVKSVTLKRGKAVWVLETEASNQSTNLQDIETVQDEGYKSQVVIEAAFVEDTEEKDDGQMKIGEWAPDQ